MSDLNVDELERSFKETVQQAVKAEIDERLSAAVQAEIAKQLPAVVQAEIAKQLPAAIQAEIAKQLPVAVQAEIVKQLPAAVGMVMAQMSSDAHKNTDSSQEAQKKQSSTSKNHNDADNAIPTYKHDFIRDLIGNCRETNSQTILTIIDKNLQESPNHIQQAICSAICCSHTKTTAEIASECGTDETNVNSFCQDIMKWVRNESKGGVLRHYACLKGSKQQ